MRYLRRFGGVVGFSRRRRAASGSSLMISLSSFGPRFFALAFVALGIVPMLK